MIKLVKNILLFAPAFMVASLIFLYVLSVVRLPFIDCMWKRNIARSLMVDSASVEAIGLPKDAILYLFGIPLPNTDGIYHEPHRGIVYSVRDNVGLHGTSQEILVIFLDEELIAVDTVIRFR